MQLVEPEIYHVAQTILKESDHEYSPEVEEYLKEIDAEGWKTDAEVGDGTEKLLEIAGRLCYRAFKPGLNENVTKVREGNKTYLANILDQHHGSVLEHGVDTYIFHNVSRVFTHELVRHRIASYSQESMRYVRLTELPFWMPESLERPEELGITEDQAAWLRGALRSIVKKVEDDLRFIIDSLDLDNKTFAQKKKLTSILRRPVGMGVTTTIMMTANHRAWRHVIEQRTSRHAEEEIRKVFEMVYKSQSDCYPNIYQDAQTEFVEGYTEVTFKNSKV